MPGRPSKEGGFTLLESLVGLFLMTTALLTLMSMFTVSGRTIMGGRRRTEATYLAQVMLDRLTNEDLVRVGLYDSADTRRISSSNLSLNATSYPFPPDDGGNGTAARAVVAQWGDLIHNNLDNLGFGTVSVARIQVGTDEAGNAIFADGLIRITVTVVWHTTRNRTSSVRLFLARRL